MSEADEHAIPRYRKLFVAEPAQQALEDILHREWHMRVHRSRVSRVYDAASTCWGDLIENGRPKMAMSLLASYAQRVSEDDLGLNPTESCAAYKEE